MAKRTKTPHERKPVGNPWPRLALASALMIWAGANIWTTIFGWKELVSGDASNRGLSIFLVLLTTILPAVIGIYLLWTVVVGPEDPRYSPRRRGPDSSHGGDETPGASSDQGSS